MIEFMLGLTAFLLVLAVLGAAADDIDARDARRRNSGR